MSSFSLHLWLHNYLQTNVKLWVIFWFVQWPYWMTFKSLNYMSPCTCSSFRLDHPSLSCTVTPHLIPIDFHMFLRCRLSLDIITPQRPSLTTKTRLGVPKHLEVSAIIAFITQHLFNYLSSYLLSPTFAFLKANNVTLPKSKYISEHICWIDEWTMR